MKAYLEIDMPENCWACEFQGFYPQGYCYKRDMRVNANRKNWRADCCPLLTAEQVKDRIEKMPFKE